MATRAAVLGPLTTVWTPPTTCANTIVPCKSGCNVGWLAQSCIETGSGSGYWIHEAVECFPPRTVGVTTPANSLFADWGVYSPGLACPAGMTSHWDCLSTYGIPNTKMALGASVTLLPGETAAGCCPTGFQCYQTPTKAECVMFITTSFVATVCDTGPMVTTLASAPPVAIVGDEGTTTTLDYYYLEAPMIQLVWHSSDLTAAGATTSSQLPQSTSSEANTASTLRAPSTATETGTPAPSSPSLSKASKIGIGVGAGLGASILLLGAACLLLLVRKHRRWKSGNVDQGRRQETPKAFRIHTSGFGELESPRPICELEQPPQNVELATREDSAGRHKLY